MIEMMEMNPTVTLYNAEQHEIGNLNSHDLVEHPVATRICT